MSSAVKIFKHFEAPKEAGLHYRLVCLTGKEKGIAYFLVGKRVVLGRSDKADIRILDIKSSREHCEVIKVGKDFVLTDLGSQNGVIVNDLKVKQHVLNEGDKVIIGKTVYKFNKIEIKEKVNKALKIAEENNTEEYQDEEFEEKSSKLSPVLILVVLAAVGIIIMSGDDKTDSVKRKKSKYTVQELPGSVSESMQGARKKDKKIQAKMNIYFQKGLREFREGNYFRAMSEFEHALSWSPNDPQAQFYLRKTKEALDNTIKDYELKARRDEDALKYQNAAVAYCAILRLLYRYPNDDRYINATEMVRKVEENLGLEEGEIECQKEIK
jgi:pSer/pThr/pTyr-binding forkhead associated (FHA) protein